MLASSLPSGRVRSELLCHKSESLRILLAGDPRAFVGKCSQAYAAAALEVEYRKTARSRYRPPRAAAAAALVSLRITRSTTKDALP